MPMHIHGQAASSHIWFAVINRLAFQAKLLRDLIHSSGSVTPTWPSVRSESNLNAACALNVT